MEVINMAKEFKEIDGQIYVITVEGFIYDLETWNLIKEDK